MAQTTGIAWTDGTVNFVIGCTPVGPGCDGCYAAAFALRKWNIKFEVGGKRHVTLSGFADPVKWQRMRDQGKTTMRVQGQDVPIPTWVFACSLSDFFDNEWNPEVRDEAWAIIKACPSLRWQLVTKRVGNVFKMLPRDWGDGSAYRHVGIVATMVNQEEINRDMRKLLDLKLFGVKWVGISIEPQIGPISLVPPGGMDFFPNVDWVITGGESKQEGHPARIYELKWAMDLVRECGAAAVPLFVKQMGDKPFMFGKPVKVRGKGDNMADWPASLRVQQMPRIYDNDAPYVPALVKPAPVVEQGLL